MNQYLMTDAHTRDPRNIVVHLDALDLIGNAEPTSRLLDGSCDQGYAEEWQQEAKLPDGETVLVMYLFSEDEISEDAENYPWDNAHIARIISL